MSMMKQACEIYDYYRADRVLNEDDRADFLVMMQDNAHPVDAAMAVSGLTVALIEYTWSKERFNLLLEGYYPCNSQMVRERIFVGLLLAMIKNNHAIRESEDLWDPIQEVLTDDAEMSFTALCNIARTTQVKYLEQFNKTISKELMPLLDKVGSDEFYDAIRKHQGEMERIALMALDQNFLIFKDAYNTSFFQDTEAHWFLPWDNEQLLNVDEDNRDDIEELLDQWPMCDSDKYAMLNVSNMLLRTLKGQFGGDILHQTGERIGPMNIMTNAYVQQMYRYFRLSKYSRVNPLELVAYLREMWVFRLVVVGEKARKVIGELLQ